MRQLRLSAPGRGPAAPRRPVSGRHIARLLPVAAFVLVFPRALFPLDADEVTRLRMRTDMTYGTDDYFGENADLAYADHAVAPEETDEGATDVFVAPEAFDPGDQGGAPDI
ncbi:MAG: hypothetical protein JXR37_02545 [Kiritimatiellae bacterium]|nr:hypothetical protein [Kiritimatiellia bacterium]